MSEPGCDRQAREAQGRFDELTHRVGRIVEQQPLVGETMRNCRLPSRNCARRPTSSSSRTRSCPRPASLLMKSAGATRNCRRRP